MNLYLRSILAQGVTLGVLILALLLGWFMLISEERDIQRDAATKLDDEALLLRQQEVQAGSVRRLADDVAHNQAEITRFRDDFLSQKQTRVVRISEFLAERAQARKVKLDEVRYSGETTRDRGLERYVAELPLTGRYRDIRALIDDIEGSGLFLIISELSLEGSSDGGRVQVQLSLATYFEGAP